MVLDKEFIDGKLYLEYYTFNNYKIFSLRATGAIMPNLSAANFPLDTEAKKNSLVNQIKTASDLNEVLRDHPQHRKEIATVMREKGALLGLVLDNNIYSLEMVCEYLSPEFCQYVINSSVEKLMNYFEYRGLEGISSLLNDLGSDQRTAVLTSIKDKLKIDQPYYVNPLLSRLSPEALRDVCTSLKDKLGNSSRHQLDEALPSHFSAEHYAVFFNSFPDLKRTYRIKDLLKRPVFYEYIKDELPRMCTSLNSLIDAFEGLTNEQRKALFDGVKDKLRELWHASQDKPYYLKRVLESLDPTQRTEVYEALKDVIPEAIHRSEDAEYAFQWFTIEQRAELFEKIKDRLNTIVMVPSPFGPTPLGKMVHYLTLEQSKEVFQAKKDYVSSVSQFEETIHGMPDGDQDKKDAFFGAVKEQLPSIIDNNKDLKRIMAILSPAQCKALCELEPLQKKLPSILPDWKTFGDLYRGLDKEKWSAFLNSSKETLRNEIIVKPTWLWNFDRYSRSSYGFTRNDINTFYETVGIDPQSLITDVARMSVPVDPSWADTFGVEVKESKEAKVDAVTMHLMKFQLALTQDDNSKIKSQFDAMISRANEHRSKWSNSNMTKTCGELIKNLSHLPKAQLNKLLNAVDLNIGNENGPTPKSIHKALEAYVKEGKYKVIQPDAPRAENNPG